MLSSAELIVLKVELDTTYSGLGDQNGTIWIQINDPDGPNSIGSFDVERVSAEKVVAAVVPADFIDLSAVQQRAWLMITGLDSVPVKDAGLRDLVQALWSGTDTLSNLQALQTRRGSHAEALFGQSVTIDDIRVARKL